MESTLLFTIICILCCLIQLNLLYTQWRGRLRVGAREKVIEYHRQGLEAGVCSSCDGEGCVGVFRSECVECKGFGYWFVPAGKAAAVEREEAEKAWDASVV